MQSMRGVFLSLCVIALCASFAHGFYSGSNVIELTSKNFDKLVLQSGEVWVVEFYAEWCGHCKKFAPEYLKVAAQLDGIVKVGGVDGDKQRELAGKYGIQGFPTVKIFAPNKKGVMEPTDFQGPRETKPVKEFALSFLKGTSLRIKGDALASFLDKPQPKALLFTDKKVTPPMWKSFSMQFSNSMVFGEVHSAEAAIVEQYAVTAFPTIVVVTDSVNKYEGNMKAPKIREWLTKFAPPNSGATGGKSKKEEPKSLLRSIAPADLNSELQKEAVKHAVVLLNNGNGGTDDEKAFESALKLLAGVVSVIRVKCDKDACSGLQAKWGVSTLPVAALFEPRDGPEAKKPRIYSGSLAAKDAKPLFEWASSGLPDDKVQVIIEQTIDMFMNAPQQKVLLFTKKEETPALYKALARDFPNVIFGEFRNPSADLMKRFNINALPTLMAVVQVPGSEVNPDGTRQVGLQPYSGPLQYVTIASWLHQMSGKANNAEESGPVSSGVVTAVRNQDDFDQYCANKGGMCVVAFLDETASNHQQQLDMLQSVAAKLRSRPANFIWMGTELASFAQPFDLPFGYPNLIALFPKKNLYAPLVGPFNAEGVESLVKDVLGNLRKPVAVSHIPAVVPTAATAEEFPPETILDDDEPVVPRKDEL